MPAELISASYFRFSCADNPSSRTMRLHTHKIEYIAGRSVRVDDQACLVFRAWHTPLGGAQFPFQRFNRFQVRRLWFLVLAESVSTSIPIRPAPSGLISTTFLGSAIRRPGHRPAHPPPICGCGGGAFRS